MEQKELDKKETNNADDSRQLKDKEGKSLYNPGAEELVKKLITSDKLKKVAKSKWFWASGGAAIMGLLIAALLLFLASLAVPNLASNILAYQFSRVSREFQQSSSADISEEIALEAETDPAQEASLVSRFGNLPGNFLDKLKSFTPQGVMEKLQENGRLVENYGKNRFGVRTLQSITIDGEDYPVSSNNILHPIEGFNSDVDLASKVSDSLQNVLADEDVGIIVRGSIEKTIMQKLDINLVAYTTSKFKGKDEAQSDLEVDREAEADINSDPAVPSDVDPIQNTETQADQDLEADVANDTTLKEIEDNGGVDPKVESDLNAEENNLESTQTTILGQADALYGIFLPLCIIYDGSLQSSNGSQTISKNSSEDQRTFFYLESAKDQQENGSAPENAVGALNDKIGNYAGSNPELRASGDTVDTTNDSISPQTAGNGQFSALNLILPGPVATAINGLESDFQVCQIITNPAVAGGLTIVQIASWLTSDGGTAAVETAAKEGVDSTMATLLGKFAQRIADRVGIDSSSEVGAKTAVVSEKLLQGLKPDKKGVASILGIAGLDFFVRMDTLSKMGEFNDGLSKGNDFANQADAGGNLNANNVNQQQFYGAPLSPTQTAYNSMEDKKYLADQNSHLSAYDRYLSLSNSYSLASKLGIDIMANINTTSPRSFFSSLGQLINPGVLFSRIYNLFDPSTKAFADSVVSGDTSDYGIVQWGYSQQEQALMAEQSYQPLENAQVLSQYTNQVNYISQTYSPCFTNDVSTLLTTNPPSSSPDSGTPYITRSTNGDVIDGLCTDKYLGPNSQDPQAADPSDGINDLVFRWRLQQSYSNSINTLTGIQNATN